MESTELTAPRPSVAAALARAGAGVLALTALGIVLGQLDPALAGHTRPHPTLSATATDALPILQNNARVLATPFLLLLLGFPASKPGRGAGDLLLVALTALSTIPVGVELGRWGSRLLPYLPHLPLEWSALSVALSAWLLARTGRRDRERTLQLAGVTLTLLIVATVLETFATPTVSPARPAAGERISLSAIPEPTDRTRSTVHSLWSTTQP